MSPSTVPASDIDYLAIPAHPDPAFAWSEDKPRRAGTSTMHGFKMLSQNWHGVSWTHDVSLQVPDHSPAPDTAVIYIGGMNNDTLDEEKVSG